MEMEMEMGMGMGGGDGSVQRAAWHGRAACGLGAWPGKSCYTYMYLRYLTLRYLVPLPPTVLLVPTYLTS